MGEKKIEKFRLQIDHLNLMIHFSENFDPLLAGNYANKGIIFVGNEVKIQITIKVLV